MDKHSTVKLHTGRTMPVMGLGTWQLMPNTADLVLHAIKIGYRLIDTSSDYGTQPGIGQAIKEAQVDREELFITTKVEETDDAYQASKAYVKEMGLDHADLIVIHRPPRTGPGIDLWQGLIKARDEGITKDIGVSNYSIDQVEELIQATGEVPVVNQIEWSPFGHDHEILDYSQEKSIIIQAYSPLTRAKRLDDPVLNRIAKDHGKSPAQVLIRWNLELNTVPIPKADDKDHQEENLEVFDFKLSEREMNLLHERNEYYSSLGPTLQYL